MLRKLGFVTLLVALALPALGAERPGTISGYVRSGSGIPQMGAVVEILGSAMPIFTVFTDENGFYSADGLLPGIYDIKVSAASFLPSWREGIGLRSGSKILVNIKLNTLFDAVKMAPAHGSVGDDDWKWVLRSSANRPILRVADDKTAQLDRESNSASDHDLKGSLSFLAGSESDGFGSVSDVTTGISIERSIFSSDTIGLHADIGYGETTPAAVIRASFRHRMEDGSEPEMALTMRSLPAPFALPNAYLQAMALSTSDSFALGDTVEMKFGSELQSIQFLGHVTAFRPFGSATVHLSPDTVVEYRYVTSEPDGSSEKGFESAPADLSESQPRVSMVNYNSALEHAHHHEISMSHRMGNTNVQFAAYYDRVVDPALTGVGEYATDGGMVLPDIYSGTFTYQGNNLKTEGMRFVVQRKLANNLTVTGDLAYGGVLDLENPGVSLASAQQFIGTRQRHSLAGKVNGVVPKTRTQWIASYRWVDGQALTPVDMFNASAGRADPFLNIFFRQPLPGGHVEAIVDLRNLLAEGYVPVLGHDGRTVYLVQSARSVRGGLNFTF